MFYKIEEVLFQVGEFLVLHRGARNILQNRVDRYYKMGQVLQSGEIIMKLASTI